MTRTVLPGFKLTLGYTLVYLTLLVIVPLLTLPIRAASVPWDQLTATITDPRVVASYRLSIGASFVAASVNAVFGLIVAWVLVRYSFPGRRIIDSLVGYGAFMPGGRTSTGTGAALLRVLTNRVLRRQRDVP